MSHKPSFEHVSMQLMMEEKAPTPEALRRWQELYPDYRFSLEEFFALWAMELEAPEVPEQEGEAAEAGISEKGMKYAMETLRQQGRLITDESLGNLKPTDQLVLTAVHLLRGRGDVADISDKVEEMGREMSLGTVLMALSRLEERGFVESRHADPATEPEHAHYYLITIAGERALAHARAIGDTEGILGDLA
jgi:hypothetical protein